MLNIRTLLLSVVLMGIITLSFRLVTARNEVVSNSAQVEARVPESQERSANLNNSYNASSYRSQLGECFDVSIQELPTCQAASQQSSNIYRSRLDECFDVALTELADCRESSQIPNP